MKRFTIVRFAALLAPLALLLAVPAGAQGPCDPTVEDYSKTVTLFDDADSSGSITPGDVLEYVILLCNTGTVDCITQTTDNLDSLIPAHPEYLDFVPLHTPCPGGPTDSDGGAQCRLGPRGGPYTDIPLADMRKCGQDCAVSPLDDNLLFRPRNTAMIAPGQCYEFMFHALLSPTIAETQCVCNNAATVIDLLGNTQTTIDPSWMSQEEVPDTPPGCLDTETCRMMGPTTCDESNTCVKVLADVSVEGEKCIDTTTPCGTAIPKVPGATVTYYFSVSNTGPIPALDVLVTDDLSFVSEPPSSVECHDITAPPLLSGITCVPAGCCPGAAGPTWASPNVRERIPVLDAGCTATFTAAVPVAATANGTCTNRWNLTVGATPVVQPSNQPTFIVDSQAILEARKCIDSAVPCGGDPDPVAKTPGATMQYLLQYENTGVLPALGVHLIDDLGGMGPGTCNITATPTATCIPDPATCPGVRCTIVTQPAPPGTPFEATLEPDMPVGCTVDVVINAGVGPGTDGLCCNSSLGSYTDVGGPHPDAVSPDRCIDVGGTATLEVTKDTEPPGTTDVQVGDPIMFNIVLHNAGTTDINPGDWTLSDTFPNCFEPLSDCSTVICIGPGCGTCASTGLGFDYTDFTLAPNDASPGGPDEITIQVTLVAAAENPACTNTAEATNGTETVRDTSTVNVFLPQIQLNKTVDPLNVGLGGTATFTIEVVNNETRNFNNCTLTDDLTGQSCMTLDDNSCAWWTPTPGTTTCTGNQVGATFNLPGSTTYSMTFTVTADAAGTCVNSATVSCPDGPSVVTDTGDAQLGIGGACDLNAVDFSSISPVTPALSTAYVLDCGAPAMPRLDPSIPEGRVAIGGPTSPADWADAPVTGTVLTMFQRACGCTEVIKMTKAATAGELHIEF